MKNFVIVRIANKPDGTVSVPVNAFETEALAWKEFYRLCGTAVDSVNPMDAVAILTKEGFLIDHKVFEHEVPAPSESTESTST